MIDHNVGGLEGMIVGVQLSWGCLNAICCARFSPCLVSFMFLREQRRSHSMFTARSKTLTKLALDWQDLLKKATNDEIC